MKYSIPDVLNNEPFLRKELTVKWDQDSTGYFLFKVENERLMEALKALNHKAVVGLSAALAEWIFWRIKGSYPIEATLPVTDALWLGLIDRRYINNWKYGADKGEDIYDNILWITLACLQEIRYHYTIGDYRILYRVVNLTMLARHIAPDKSQFDNWLGGCLERATEFFPARYDRDDVRNNPDNYNKCYDSSSEPPIPREFFFEPGFDYKTANIDELLERFINGLDHSNELYFKSEDDMIKEGFIGMPYVFKKNSIS